jgi:hypothetical protein
MLDLPTFDARDEQFLDLTDRIFAARDGHELIALAPEILAFTGGRLTLDFGELWYERWRVLEGDKPVPEDLWPTEDQATPGLS